MLIFKPHPTTFLGLPPNIKNTISKGIDVAYTISLFDAIEEALRVSKEEIQSSSRKREITEARYIFVGLLLEVFPEFGLKRLGVIIGNRDHSTVIHSRETFNALTDGKSGNKQYIRKVNLVKYVLSNQ